MTTFIPRNDYVLILPDEAEKMKGSLYLPADSIRIPTRGTVVATGPGYMLETGSRGGIELEVGARVEFQLQPGDVPRDIDGVSHFLIKEVQILSEVEDEPVPEVVPPPPDDEPEEVEPVRPGRLVVGVR